MRSSWPVRVLLPTVQVLAEGGWLAVVYAALQSFSGEIPRIGPIELALLAWMGLSWGRRSHWLSAGAEAIGLPALMVVGGAVGWLLAPEARTLLVQGQLVDALGTHMAGWIGAIAVWRGDAHRVTDDDDQMADQLLRWAVPGLAIPWLIGHQLTTGAAEVAFTSAAFMGTVVFTGSAFTAMGLARLEAVRRATGSDWRANRSWLLLVLGVALALTVVGIPAAAVLGVPASALLVALVGPLRVFLLLLLLLSTPLIVVIAALTEVVGSFLPQGFKLPDLDLPAFFAVDPAQVVSDAPTVIVFSVAIILAIIELAVLALIIYLRWQERRRYRFVPEDPFEERAIVIPVPEPGLAPTQPRRSPSRPDPADPTGAYLIALVALERDGRWPRRATETPASHAGRAAREGLTGSAFPRLAAAYQLVRYAERQLGGREAGRGRGRLARLRAILRSSGQGSG
ncbi:MAG TPA: DUF4129 domain-containing protein [Candidatus Limnocylindria bacterium]|nr:DUF4129 domain-containing protein [Candidatus Limnocylindria bacterium]